MSESIARKRRFGGEHGYGHTQDPPGHLVSRVPLKLVKPGATPSSASIEAHSILDQGYTSSCVGHAIAAAIWGRMKKRGTPIALPSPICIYDLARCIDRNGPHESLVDEGSMPNQAMRGLTEWGAASAQAWGHFPADPFSINDEPALDQLEAAAEFKLLGYYRIDSTGSSRVELMRNAISQGFPICIAIDVDTAFEDYAGKGMLGAPNPNDLLGGHYVYVNGYETYSTTKTAWHFPNSWGEGWGKTGVGIGDERFIAGAMDIYVMDVHQTQEA